MVRRKSRVAIGGRIGSVHSGFRGIGLADFHETNQRHVRRRCRRQKERRFQAHVSRVPHRRPNTYVTHSVRFGTAHPPKRHALCCLGERLISFREPR